MGTFYYIPQVTGGLASEAASSVWVDPSLAAQGRGVVKREGSAAVVFLEFPGGPDTGSPFPRSSGAMMWGQTGRVLPPAEEQLSKESPSPSRSPGLGCHTRHAQ